MCLWILGLTSTMSVTGTDVYTPRGSYLQGTYNSNYTAEEIEQSIINHEVLYPNATQVDTWDRNYNCHSYAWWVSAGGSKSSSWLNNPSMSWTDGSFAGMSQYSSTASRVVYYQSGTVDHSAVVMGSRYQVRSKWGLLPLYDHSIYDCPYYQGATLKYYALNNSIQGEKVIALDTPGQYVNKTYSITNPPSTGSFVWTVSYPTTIVSGQGSSSIVVNMGSDTTIGASLHTAQGLTYPLPSINVLCSWEPIVTDIVMVEYGSPWLESHFKVVCNESNSTFYWSVDNGASILPLPYPTDAIFMVEPNVYTYIQFPSAGSYTISVYGQYGNYVGKPFSKTLTASVLGTYTFN